MKNRILYNWTVQRVFYVLIGLIIIIGSVVQKEWLGMLLGGYFFSMGVFAFGCAGANGCYTSHRSHAKHTFKQGNLE